MSSERAQILNMLKTGKISVQETEDLLDVLESNEVRTEPAAEAEVTASEHKAPKYLRVQVDGCGNGHGKHEKVNVRVPLQLLRAGVKFASLLPSDAKSKVDEAFKDKGMSFDLSNFKPEDLDPLIEALAETSIDVDADDEKVRIFCE